MSRFLQAARSACILVLVAPLAAQADSENDLAELVGQYEASKTDAAAFVEFHPRFVALADRSKGSETGLEALLWIVRKSLVLRRKRGEMNRIAAEAAARAIDGYPNSKRLSLLVLYGSRFSNTHRVRFFRKLLRSEERSVRGAAHLGLLRIAMQKKDGAAAADGQLEAIRKSYADVAYFETRLGELANATRHPHSQEELKNGAQAPGIAGRDLAGRAIDLADFRGKVVLVYFWYEVTRSKLVFEFLRKYSKRLRELGEPCVLLTVATGMSRSRCRKLVEQHGIDWPCIYDGATFGPIRTRWRARLNTFLVIDHRGIIHDRETPMFMGKGNDWRFVSDDDIDHLVSRALMLQWDSDADWRRQRRRVKNPPRRGKRAP